MLSGPGASLDTTKPRLVAGGAFSLGVLDVTLRPYATPADLLEASCPWLAAGKASEGSQGPLHCHEVRRTVGLRLSGIAPGHPRDFGDHHIGRQRQPLAKHLL